MASDSSGARRDVIFDFDDQGDGRINLGAVFGPALTFIGTSASTLPGQVPINDTPDAHQIIDVNLDGNTATAEMKIQLFDTTFEIGADDFILV